jgi:hypothetical protein
MHSSGVTLLLRKRRGRAWPTVVSLKHPIYPNPFVKVGVGPVLVVVLVVKVVEVVVAEMVLGPLLILEDDELVLKELEEVVEVGELEELVEVEELVEDEELEALVEVDELDEVEDEELEELVEVDELDEVEVVLLEDELIVELDDAVEVLVELETVPVFAGPTAMTVC